MHMNGTKWRKVKLNNSRINRAEKMRRFSPPQNKSARSVILESNQNHTKNPIIAKGLEPMAKRLPCFLIK